MRREVLLLGGLALLCFANVIQAEVSNLVTVLSWHYPPRSKQSWYRNCLCPSMKLGYWFHLQCKLYTVVLWNQNFFIQASLLALLLKLNPTSEPSLKVKVLRAVAAVSS